MLREQQSADFLNALAVHHRPVILADLAFALPAAPDHISLLPADNHPLRIGVTVMDRGAQDPHFQRQAIYEDALVSLLMRLRASYAAHFYVFCQCYGPSPDQDDRQCARRIYERIHQQEIPATLLDGFSDALEIRSAYKAMACVIGTRMHAGIFALSHGVPAILIGYQPKALGTMNLFGLERYCCDIERFTGDDLYRLTCEIMEQRQDLSLHIRERYLLVQDLLHNWTSHLQG